VTRFGFDCGGYDVATGAVESQGEARAYSALGPRVDGAQKPDLLAPDKPWLAAPYLADSQSPYGGYHVFGGTSGAAPHVAGVLALLAQAGLRGDAAKAALTSNAAHDAMTGAVWNARYGFGRVDAAAALGAGPTGSPPTLRVAASRRPS
jgi:subtilisin family serine protease